MSVEPGRRGPDLQGATVAIGRDPRLRAHIAAIVGVALLVVLGGLGLVGPPDEAAGPSPSSGPRTGAPSGAPSTPSGTTGAPTPGRIAICAGAGPGDPPTVRLRSTSDDQSPVPGTAGPAPSDGPSGSPVIPAWTVPGLERGLLLPPGASLILDAQRSVCIVSVDVAVAGAHEVDPGSAIGQSWRLEPGRPSEDVDLGSLPAGDWVVRVEVEFLASTGRVSPTSRVAFFRVVAGDSLDLAPSPQVTPAVACGPDPIGAGSPELVLVVDDGPPISSRDGGGANPVEIRLGQRIEVRVVGDVCARGWSIDVADGLGNAFLQESYPNPVDNPFLAAQNRWVLTQLLIGDSTLTSSIQFGRDRAAVGTWALRVITPGLPAAFATASDGRSVPALPGCGQFWTLPGGDAFEPCFVQTVPDDLEPLQVIAGSVVRISLDDWAVASWFARCGLASASEGLPAEFRTLDECDLGGRSTLSLIGFVPSTIAFVPWPGDRLVLIGITAERDGVTAYGNYYIRVEAAP